MAASRMRSESRPASERARFSAMRAAIDWVIGQVDTCAFDEQSGINHTGLYVHDGHIDRDGWDGDDGRAQNSGLESIGTVASRLELQKSRTEHSPLAFRRIVR